MRRSKEMSALGKELGSRDREGEKMLHMEIEKHYLRTNWTYSFFSLIRLTDRSDRHCQIGYIQLLHIESPSDATPIAFGQETHRYFQGRRRLNKFCLDPLSVYADLTGCCAKFHRARAVIGILCGSGLSDLRSDHRCLWTRGSDSKDGV